MAVTALVRIRIESVMNVVHDELAQRCTISVTILKTRGS